MVFGFFTGEGQGHYTSEVQMDGNNWQSGTAEDEPRELLNNLAPSVPRLRSARNGIGVAEMKTIRHTSGKNEGADHGSTTAAD